MLHYLRCSYDGTRDGEEKHGTFSFLIEAESKDAAIRKMIDAVKASRKEDKTFFPPSARVYVDHLIEVIDPLDVGLIFNLEEEELKENELKLFYVRDIPDGYESKGYRVNNDDEGNFDPVFSFGRTKKKK